LIFIFVLVLIFIFVILIVNHVFLIESRVILVFKLLMNLKVCGSWGCSWSCKLQLKWWIWIVSVFDFIVFNPIDDHDDVYVELGWV